MKKKFLSLMMAAAVVATTSVSAFADTNITDSDNMTPTTDIQITGNVIDDNGRAPVGTFNVTVPTAASFTVTQAGKLEGTKIKVTNNGTQDIDVYADKFIDTTVGGEINVVAESSLADSNRTNVSLKIIGNLKTLFLKSEDTNEGEKNGIYTDNALKVTASGENLKLANVGAKKEYDLTLSGTAGEKKDSPVTKPVSDSFTLRLKIKKSTDKSTGVSTDVSTGVSGDVSTVVPGGM